MIRSPRTQSSTISRYRGSNTCSGRNTLGNRTTFGSGKIGMVGGSIINADWRLAIADSRIGDWRLAIHGLAIGDWRIHGLAIGDWRFTRAIRQSSIAKRQSVNLQSPIVNP